MVPKKDTHEQFNLFGVSTVVQEPKKKRNVLSDEEKLKRKEKEASHRAWKLLKSGRYNDLLTPEDKRLLLKYYGIKI